MGLQQNQQMGQLRSQSYRYVNLVLFVLAGCCNNIPPNAFTAVAPTISRVYDIDEIYVNSNNMIYPIMYVIMIFPVNYILETYGLKIGTLIGEAFIIVGLLIRLLINLNYYFFLVGTFITGFGFCFMMNSPNKFAASWFPVQEIALVNSISVFAIFVSDSIGSFTSALFIKEETATQQTIFQFFLYQTIIIVSINVLMVFFFRGKPKYPPNYASEVPRQQYWKSFKKLMKNKNYKVLFASMTFVFGFMGVLFSTISWQVQAYGLSSIDTGILIIIANITGCICSVANGQIFKSTNYRRNLIIMTFAATFGLVVVDLGYQFHSKILFYIGGGIFGMFIFPYLTTMIDFASETAFPVGQAVSGGSLFFGGQVFGVLTSYLATILFFNGKSMTRTRIGGFFEIILMLIGAIILFASKEQLKRSDYERSKREGDKVSLISEDCEN